MTARGSLFLLQIALLFQLLFKAVDAQDNQPNNNDNASTTVESIFDSAKGIKVGGSILAVLAIATGAVVCLAGYKLFRPALFVVGFALGGVLVAIAVEHIFKSESWVVTASWIAFVVGGIVIGCLAIAFYSLSIFLAGAAGGVVLAMLVNTSFGYKIYPSHPNVVLLVLAIVLGIIGGVLALKLEKPVLIIATAFVGAAMLVWGVGYFAGDFPSSSDLKAFANQDANGDWVYSIPSAWWVYLAGVLVLAALGAAVQFRKTGRGVKHSRKTHHSHGAPWRSHAVPSSRAAEQEDEVYVEVQTPQKDSRARFGNPVSHV